MRKIVLSAVIAAATLSAMPAFAKQWKLQASVQRQIQSDINQLDQRIDAAAQRGTISRREATSLRGDASSVQSLYNRLSRNGLDHGEVGQLETQVNRIHQRLKFEKRDWDGRRG
ncbi:hypothetical protein GCM10011491_39190 [Brucella endophytica]|uniref:Uncharacterized protein n=1 Tax=Brucella endophytica TaxID=1963359 RepID=A0A916WKU4_9HYPH|nr:hypothetical protein [Brucella endophytica]GGB07251.1 hypothetical protein GCM10011491_39190 [Brucella endophytica]